MIQRKKLSDERFNGMCCYCGDFPDTRDHVPSKVLLDDPYPENLPVVECCNSCNQGFSTDEEYFACAIECLKRSSAEVENLNRVKIKRILAKKPALQKKLSESFIMTAEGLCFQIDDAAFRNVILKLARGHISFEVSAPEWADPKYLIFKPIYLMTEEEKEGFFSAPEITLYPEVGSRLMLKFVEDQPNVPYSMWNEVQKDNYYFLVNCGSGEMTVRIFIADILAIECIWSDEQ